jgi:two-component system sensor histidine kinase RegB
MKTNERTRGHHRGLVVAERTLSPDVALRWLVNLRWHAVVGQSITIAVAVFALHRDLPVAKLFGVVALTALSNALLLLPSRRRLLGLVIGFDTMALTMLLALSGGGSNPFAMLYLVHVALAAFVLETRPTTLLTGFVAVAFGLLVSRTSELPSADRWATWLALVLSAIVIAVVVRRLANALRQQHDALLRAERGASRAETIAALGTLAAGAAHELATPLGTIAVAANELDRLIVASPERAVDDACLIRDEVDRCREILFRMSAHAGERIAELPTTVKLAEIRRRVLEGVGSAEHRRIAWLAASEDDELTLPALGLSQALGTLVTNALAATRSDGSVVVIDVLLDERDVEFVVSDRGPGIPHAIRDRLGDPFLTTKPVGQGMGLGIFLCQSFVDAWCGALDFVFPEDGGTVARVRFPRTLEAR